MQRNTRYVLGRVAAMCMLLSACGPVYMKQPMTTVFPSLLKRSNVSILVVWLVKSVVVVL